MKVAEGGILQLENGDADARDVRGCAWMYVTCGTCKVLALALAVSHMYSMCLDADL